MTKTEASRIRSAVAGLPFTGGGVHTRQVLERWDKSFQPIGRKHPKLEDVIALLEGVGSAQKRDLENFQIVSPVVG